MKLLKRILDHKTLSKIRYSTIWKLIRLFHPHAISVDESLILIKKAEAASQKRKHTKSSTLTTDGQRILIPAFRSDGVGIQAMVRMSAMFLARQANATYVHLPFLKVAHKDIDYQNRSLTSEKWVAKWEAFFNLGKDEFDITDLANTMERTKLAKSLASKKRRLGDDIILRRMIPSLVKKIRNRDVGNSGIYTVDLGLCGQARKCQLFFDEEFIQILQEKFRANGYISKETLYSTQHLNIAIHIRRGDVWSAYQSGSKKRMYKNRLVGEDYYVKLLRRLQGFFRLSPKPVRFHIFSDGRPDDFDKFTFTDEHEAVLKLESGFLIENIQFHLRHSAIDTLYHLIKAPIFVPGKSTFSVLAALLNNSYVLYEEEICEFYQYALLEKYMKGNLNFISLTKLEDRAVDIIEALTNQDSQANSEFNGDQVVMSGS